MKFNTKLSIFWIIIISIYSIFVFYSYKKYNIKKNALVQLNRSQIEKIEEIIQLKTVNQLNSISNLAKLTNQINPNKISSIKNTQLIQLFKSYLDLYPHLHSCYIGYENGNFLLVGITNNGYRVKTINVDKNIHKTDHYNNDFIKEKSIAEPIVFNPTTRVWYKGAITNNDIFWSSIYVFFSSKKPGITVSYPIQTSHKKETTLDAVIGFDIEINHLTKLFANKQFFGQNKIILLDESNNIIATSYNTNLFLALFNQYHKVTLSDIKDNVATLALSNYNSTQQKTFNHRINNINYTVGIKPLKLTKEIEWKLLIITTYDEILSTLLLKNETQFVKSLIIISGIFLIIICIITLIIKIIRGLFNVGSIEGKIK